MKPNFNKEYQEKLEIEHIHQTIQVLGHFFKSSFGPKGLDKLLFDHFNDYMLVTNDGGTIIDDLGDLLKPEYSKYILKWGKNIHKEEKDGVKTFYIILGEVLKVIDDLINENIAISNILKALALMKKKWKLFINENSFRLKSKTEINEKIDTNNKNITINEELEFFLRDYLRSILSGKLSKKNIGILVDIIHSILLKAKKNNIPIDFKLQDYYQILKVPGTQIQDSTTIDAFYIAKSPANTSIIGPNGISNARLLLISQKLYIDLPDGGDLGPQGFEYDIVLDADTANKEMLEWKKNKAKETFEYINSVKPDVIITEKGIDKILEGYFERNNILAIRRAKIEQMRLLSKKLKIKIVENIKNISQNDIATVNKVEYKKYGRDKQLFINIKSIGQKEPYMVNSFSTNDFGGTIIVGGSLWYACEAAERIILKAFQIGQKILLDNKFLYGGGNTELRFIKYIKESLEPMNEVERDKNIDGKTRYAVYKISRSLLMIPETLCINSSMNPLDIIPYLTSNIYSAINNEPRIRYGIDMDKIQVNDMQESKIYDNITAKSKIIERVLSIGQQLTKIDKIITKSHRAKKRDTNRE